MPEDLQLWKGFDGHGLYAKRAEKDRNGEEIVTTYAKKTDVPALTDELNTSETTAVTPGAVKSAIDSLVHIPDTANQPSTLYVGGQGMDWTGWETGEIDVPVDGLVIDGRIYKTAVINGVVWLAENLDWRFKVNGNLMPINLRDNPDTAACWYYDRNQTDYGIDGTYKCGMLYNWYAIKYLNDNRASMIPGWHVPSLAEWNAVINAAGGSSVAGKKLKAANNTVTDNWPSNWAGTDDYGFGVLPAGMYNYPNFSEIGASTRYWTTTINSYDSPNTINFNRTDTATVVYNMRTSAFPVRLVKDS